MCIKVNVDLAVVADDEGIGIRVNCNQKHYNKSKFQLTIIAEHHGKILNNVTAMSICNSMSLGDTVEVPFESLKCGISYTFKIYWIADQGSTECFLKENDGEQACSGNLHTY